MPDRVPPVKHFSVFDVNLDTGEIRKRGVRLKIQEKPFLVLAALLERPGAVVSRETLQHRLWPGDTFVEFEGGLNAAVAKLRDTLDDSAATPRFVETLPRRGYRFIAPVTQETSEVDHTAPRAAPPPARRAQGFVPRLVGGVTVLLTVGLLAYVEFGNPVRTTSHRALVMVLPFDQLGLSDDQAYMAEGLAEELGSQLARFDPASVGVIAHTTASYYKRTGESIGEIRDRLDVDYVVEGSVRRVGDDTRVTVRLIRSSDQAHIWTDSFDVGPIDLLTLGTSAGQQVRQALARTLGLDEVPVTLRASTRDPGAYDAYLKGRYEQAQGGADATRRAIASLSKAIRRDDGFAAAHAALARSYSSLAFTDRRQADEWGGRALSAATRAVELAPDLAEAQAALATALWFFARDLEGAGRAFEQALRLGPGLAEVHADAAWYLSAGGRHAEAISAMQRAVELDPASFAVKGDLGYLYLAARQPALAVRECRRAVELEPTFEFGFGCLVRAYAASGDLSKAKAAALRYMTLFAASDAEVASVTHASDDDALQKFWRWDLDRLQRQATNGHRNLVALASRYAQLRESTKALELLEQAAETEKASLMFLAKDTDFDSIRADARFVRLLTRLGLTN